MTYEITTASNVSSRQRAVNRAIAAGCTPIGGVAAWTSGALLMQAVTR